MRCRFLYVYRLAAVSLATAIVGGVAHADVFNMGPGLTDLRFVTVGHPHNSADTQYNGISVGSVDQAYRIGKFEVTAGQYTEFLNAVATTDTYGLYDPLMSDLSFRGCNIQRSGSPGSYSYSVAPDWADRPVNMVTFWDAVRFVNWLHNGQPSGAQGAATTEEGTYHHVGNQPLFGRNLSARFFIPSEDEWYKAAYHKNDGASGNYWDYPTATDTPPINTLPDPGNHANFTDAYGTGNNGFTIGAPYYRTNAGEFENSPGPYGTFDQGGNVWEWNDTRILTNYRGLRGGSFVDYSDHLYAASRYYNLPTLYNHEIGFRVATVIPEPGSLPLVAIGAFALLVRRKSDAAKLSSA
jgi:formylglycine-generating enzyme required for sulfatase activity